MASKCGLIVTHFDLYTSEPGQLIRAGAGCTPSQSLREDANGFARAQPVATPNRWFDGSLVRCIARGEPQDRSPCRVRWAQLL